MDRDALQRLSTYSLDKNASPASEEQMAAFEAELGMSFPDEYRTFLLQSGPLGIERAARIPVEGGGDTSISALYGLGCKPSWDVRHQTMDVYSGRVPDETIPIGEDGDSGDIALLSLEGEQRGRVFIWWHDHPEIDPTRLRQMYSDLAAAGQSVGQMNDAAVIHAWEHAHADELGYRPLWGNIRPIASSFDDLLRLIAG